MKMKLGKEMRVFGIAVLSVLIFGQCNKNEIEDQFDCSTSSLAASAETTESDCGSATATIEVTASGGLAPYLYKLDDGAAQAASTFNNVEPGLYQITITDANSCTFVVNQMVMSTTSYITDIEPIISMNCAISGCHNGSTSLPDFRSLATVQANSGNIKSFTQTGFMPRNGSLSQNEIDLIACWVDDGALNN